MLFEIERSAFRKIKVLASIYDTMFLSSAVIGFGVPLFLSPSLDKIQKAALTTLGMSGAICYTAASKIHERIRRVDDCAESAQFKTVKAQLNEEEEVAQLEAAIEGSTRKVELIIEKAQPWAWAWWAKRAGVEANMPPLQDLTQETVEQPVIPNPAIANGSSVQIASIEQSQVDAIVAPSEMVQLEELARVYPKYIRIDEHWIGELCNASSNPNMSKRYNHHFVITGETQSGKSTIAGIIINKIVAVSAQPSIVIGNDPKDGVSRWLCGFSYRFDGIKSINNWIQFAYQKANEQKTEYSRNPRKIGELFFIQDEVDSVYNGGKGFLGFPGADKKAQKAQADSLQSLWNFLVKYMAGCKGHYIGIGQSPLSGDTGLSRPAYKSCCFIALGNTANYIFDHPQDFLNVKKETQEVLQQAFELMINMERRCALVVPMRGNPYVALIPQFDIEAMTAPKTEPVDTDTPEYRTVDQVMDAMMEWMQSLEELPTPNQVREQWEELSNQPLNDSQLVLILEQLGLGE